MLRFRAGGNEHSRAYLPVRPRGAKVVATDSHGRPALLRHVLGDGETVLCTYPIEHFAAVSACVNPEDTNRLCAALSDVAGIRREITVDTPSVFADTLVHEDGRRFAWLVSQNPERCEIVPHVSGGSLHELATGERQRAIVLQPYGVRVLQLRTEI